MGRKWKTNKAVIKYLKKFPISCPDKLYRFYKEKTINSMGSGK